MARAGVRQIQHKTRDTKHKTQNTKHKTRDTKHATQHKTQNTKHKTQNTKHATQKKPSAHKKKCAHGTCEGGVVVACGESAGFRRRGEREGGRGGGEGVEGGVYGWKTGRCYYTPSIACHALVHTRHMGLFYESDKNVGLF